MKIFKKPQRTYSAFQFVIFYRSMYKIYVYNHLHRQRRCPKGVNFVRNVMPVAKQYQEGNSFAKRSVEVSFAGYISKNR
jgi:hypothetical protein